MIKWFWNLRRWLSGTKQSDINGLSPLLSRYTTREIDNMWDELLAYFREQIAYESESHDALQFVEHQDVPEGGVKRKIYVIGPLKEALKILGDL